MKMKKDDIISKLKTLDFDPDEYWVIMGAAMVIYGIKEETPDIDLGCTSEMADRLEEKGCLYKVTPDGNRWLRVGSGVEVFENWLYDTIVVKDEIPIISIQGLLTMKQRSGREKDSEDIELIKKYLKIKC